MKKKKLEKLFNDEYFINDVCSSYTATEAKSSVDFSHLNEEEKKKRIFEYRRWMNAILNNIDYHKNNIK